MVTILMTYVSGVQSMLEVAFRSLSRHDAGCPYMLVIVTDVADASAYEEAKQLFPTVVRFDVGPSTTGSGQHAKLLDRAIEGVITEFFLTLDSDCFPVADGWLKRLVEMCGEDVAASGIVWPWIPPPETLDHKTIEWRIRSNHCWNNLQPACQLMRKKLFVDNGWKFADDEGYDTNCGTMLRAHAAGMKINGLMPTRGPIPDIEFDPETNRHESVVFGDMIYHHVGATRESRSGISKSSDVFKTARARVYAELGAEWMLQPGNSHMYALDREEAVAQVKMEMMYRSMVDYLGTHDGLFRKGWAL